MGEEGDQRLLFSFTPRAGLDGGLLAGLSWVGPWRGKGKPGGRPGDGLEAGGGGGFCVGRGGAPGVYVWTGAPVALIDLGSPWDKGGISIPDRGRTFGGRVGPGAEVGTGPFGYSR